MRSLGSTRIEVLSPLSPAECVARLDAAIECDSTMLHYKSVVGKVRGDSLRLRKRIWYRNSFQTLLWAKLVPERKGTAFPET